MAVLIPVIGSYSNECNIEIGTGLVDAVAGDVLLYSDIAAALDAAGYGWTAMYDRFAATYATARDAEIAFNWEYGNGSLLADRILINDLGPAPWNFGVQCCANIGVVRQTERAATIRLQNPRVTDGVPTGNNPVANIAYVANTLASTCDVKAVLGAVYPTIESLVSGLGNNCVTWGVGFGNVPNYQAGFVAFGDGSIRGRLQLQTSGGSEGYSYLTIDMGWSAAR